MLYTVNGGVALIFASTFISPDTNLCIEYVFELNLITAKTLKVILANTEQVSHGILDVSCYCSSF